MLDFPNSPTTGQIFTAGGSSWIWDGVKWASNSGGGGFLPLSGGTVSGPLTVTGTTTLQGNAILNGSATLTTAQAKTFSAKGGGTNGGYAAYDNGTAPGDTTKAAWFYRNANTGRLSMDEFGDVLQFTTTGAATFLGTLTVNGQINMQGPAYANVGLTAVNIQDNGWLHISGGAQNDPLTVTVNNGYYARTDYTVSGTRTWSCGCQASGSFGIADESAAAGRFAIGTSGVTTISAADYYPLQISTTGGQATSIYHLPAGQHTWMDGPMSNVGQNTFYIYNNTSGGTRFGLNSSQSFIYGDTYPCYGGGRFICGQSGYWEGNSQSNFSLYTGVGAMAVYGGATAGGWAVYGRVDGWQTYNFLIIYGSTACGSITCNGTNAFFNTSCDVRRKDNIRSLHSEIDVGGIIDALKPVAFEWKPYEFKTLDQPAVVNMDIDGNDNGTPLIEGKLVQVETRTDHGFIAQDLYEVLPGIVHKPENDEELMQADYSKMMPYVIAELQALRKRVAELEGH